MDNASRIEEPTLADLVSLWQRRRAEGQSVTPAELCRDHPDLLPELQKRIAALERMSDLADTSEGTLPTLDFLEAPVAPLPAFWPKIPGYEIVGELGRGGMGVVYKARQASLNRVVALKMILAGSHAGHEAITRFLREAETIARLKHPHVVQVHEFGSHEGKPFFSLEYLEGGSLAAKLRGEPQPPAQAAQIVEVLARAVEAAHAQGIVHRDLKPANVLLTADGIPKLTDFGLAKQADSGMTATGQVLGTPSYMAPEQAGGESKGIGPAADIYALGAILYELLTGRPPFKGTSAWETLQQVVADEAVSVRRLQPKVPRDLETVCHKCLEKNPQKRYPSAAALAEDLRRFGRGEPVSARPVGVVGRAAKWARRRPTVAALLVLVALVAGTGLGGILWAYGKAVSERERARGEAQRADDEAAVAKAVNEFLQKDLLGQVDIGNQAESDERNPNVTVRELLDRAGRKIEGKFAGQELTEAAIRQTLGNAYQALGLFGESQRHFERSLQLRTAKLGPDHPDTLSSKNDLAWLYFHQAKYDLAEPLFQNVLQGRTTQLGADHPETLNSKNNLASMYQYQAKYDLAEPLFQEVLEGRLAKLGADHPDTLTSKHDLALLYHVQGKFDLAEPLYKEVLQAETAKLGPDHPNNLITKNCLAGLYNDQGKYDLAEPLYKEVLQTQTAKLGADHPDTLTTKGNLASLYNDEGKYDLAEPLYQEVLQGETAKLGPDHPNTLSTKFNVASLYQDQGKYELAEKLFQEVLRTRTAKLGVEHPHTLGTMARLGLNSLRQKKYADAEPILRQCLDIREKKQADQWSTFDTRSMLGEALAGQKKYAEAEPLLVQGYEGMKQREKDIPPQYKVRLSEALERLVQLYDVWGKKDKADAYRQKLAAERARSQATTN